MRQMLTAVRQIVRQTILVMGLVALISVSGLMLNQPSYAAAPASQEVQEEPINVLDFTEAPATREEAYEEAAKVAETPDSVVKAEEKEIKAFKQQQPNKGLVEGAQDLIEKVSGNS